MTSLLRRTVIVLATDGHRTRLEPAYELWAPTRHVETRRLQTGAEQHPVSSYHRGAPKARDLKELRDAIKSAIQKDAERTGDGIVLVEPAVLLWADPSERGHVFAPSTVDYGTDTRTPVLRMLVGVPETEGTK